MAQLRAKAGLLHQHVRQWATRVPVKARVVLVLFLVAALLMAVHTALTANDASLHLKLQHGFHEAQVSLWVDGDLAFSGKITGAPKKKFGLIPTDSVQAACRRSYRCVPASIVSVCGSNPTTPRCRKTASAGILPITRSGTFLSPLGPVRSRCLGKGQAAFRQKRPRA